MTGPELQTDEELYRQVQNGDRAALQDIYRRRQPALLRYVLHMSGSFTLAEDITQEAFLKLIAPGAGFDASRGTLEAYLYGIARNLLRRVRTMVSLNEISEPAREQHVLEKLVADQITAALYACIRELPEAYREAVVLCDLEERSYEDAAGLIGCPVGTVRSRLHRARALLAQRLEQLKFVEAKRRVRD